jgi:hypothetical protein
MCIGSQSELKHEVGIVLNALHWKCLKVVILSGKDLPCKHSCCGGTQYWDKWRDHVNKMFFSDSML